MEPTGQETASEHFLLGGGEEIHVLIISNYREEGFSAITAKVIMASFDLQDVESWGKNMS